jgi:O-antigen/teichoic acid export membrane protein
LSEPETPLEILDTPEAGTKVIRGGVLRAAGYGGGLLVGLISTPLMLRHLGVDDFGRYITVNSLIFIVAGLTELGLTNVGMREYTLRDPSKRGRLIQNLAGMRTVFTLAGVGVAALFGIVAGYSDVMVIGTLIAGLGLVATNLQYTYTVPLSAQLKLGWVAALDLIRQLVIAALIVALVVAGASLLPFFTVVLASGLVTLAIAIVLVRGDVPLSPAADRSEWWALLKDTLPYAAATALGVVYFRIAVILMSLIASPTETGYFSAAFRIIEIVAAIPWLLINSAFPVMVRAARDNQDRLRYALQRLFEVSLIAGVWMALVVWAGAPFAISVLGGDDFGPSVDALRALGFAMIGTFLVATWGLALLSLRRHSALLVANGCALALGIGLTFALEPSLGATGAGVATAATEIGLGLLYIAIIGRGRPDLLPRPRILLPVLAAAAVAAAPMIVGGIPSVVLACVATLLYFGVLVALRAIPQEVTDALLRRGSFA